MRRAIWSAIPVLVCAAAAHAGLSIPFYTQNFDGMTSGNINGQSDSGPLAGASTWGGGTTPPDADVIQNTTAVSGKALEASSFNLGLNRVGIFAPVATSRVARVSFDILFESVIQDFAGTPGVDMQEAVQFRGPSPFKQFFLVYKAFTDPSGTPFVENLEFRALTTQQSNPSFSLPLRVQKNVFYHVEMVVDFKYNTFDGIITQQDGTTFFDPPQMSGFNADGNVNQIIMASDNSPNANFVMDNLGVFIPEPASLGLIGLGAVTMLRRRR